MTPPSGGGGQDGDGDGDTDTFTYAGCFKIDANEVFSFDNLDGDDKMTPTVISLLQVLPCCTSAMFPGVLSPTDKSRATEGRLTGRHWS